MSAYVNGRRYCLLHGFLGEFTAGARPGVPRPTLVCRAAPRMLRGFSARCFFAIDAPLGNRSAAGACATAADLTVGTDLTAGGDLCVDLIAGADLGNVLGFGLGLGFGSNFATKPS